MAKYHDDARKQLDEQRQRAANPVGAFIDENGIRMHTVDNRDGLIYVGDCLRALADMLNDTPHGIRHRE